MGDNGGGIIRRNRPGMKAQVKIFFFVSNNDEALFLNLLCVNWLVLQ